MSGIQIPYRTLDWHSSHRRRSLPKSKAGRSCAVLCGIRVLRTAHGCGRSSYMGSWRYGLRLRAPPTARLSIPANLEYSYARLQLSIISPPLHFACPNMFPLGRRRLLAGITSSSCRSYVVCCTPYVKFIVQAPSTSHFIAEQEHSALHALCTMHYASCIMHTHTSSAGFYRRDPTRWSFSIIPRTATHAAPACCLEPRVTTELEGRTPSDERGCVPMPSVPAADVRMCASLI